MAGLNELLANRFSLDSKGQIWDSGVKVSVKRLDNFIANTVNSMQKNVQHSNDLNLGSLVKFANDKMQIELDSALKVRQEYAKKYNK